MKKFELKDLNKKAKALQEGIKQYSPLISMVIGTGLVLYGAKQTYDASQRIARITAELERRKAEGENISRKEVITRIGKEAVVPTVLIGGGLVSFFNAYHVLTNRLGIVSGLLASSLKENDRIRTYIREKHPEVSLIPTTGEKKQVYASKDEIDKKKPKMVDAVKPLDICNYECVSYRLSLDYASDDDTLNMLQIQSSNKILSNKLMQDGSITLADVYGVLRINPSNANYNNAARLKWTDSDYFELYIEMVTSYDDNGVATEIPFISWPAPKPVDGTEFINKNNEGYIY